MASSERSRESVETPEQDGGRKGWVAILALWSSSFVWVEVTKGFGIMLPTIQEQLDTQTWIVGWITAAVASTGGLVAPFAVPLSKRFEGGHIFIACGAVTGLSLIAAVFVVTPRQLAACAVAAGKFTADKSVVDEAALFRATLLLKRGCAHGVTDVVSKEAVGRCYTKNYATATGLARTGYSIGLFVCAPLVQLFLNTYGWRGTMLLTGALSLHLVVCGCLMVTAHLPRAKPSQYQIVEQDEHPKPNQRANVLHYFAILRKYVIQNFDASLLVNARYWAVATITCCSAFSYSMWIVYFVSQAESNGFTLLEASTMVTVAGVANLISKLLQGFITDRGVISNWSLLFICLVANSASYFASSFLTSYWLLMTSAIVILFSEGIISCQYDVLAKKLLGVELLAGAFAWIGLTLALMTLSMGFLPGWLYDTTGSYTGGFLLIGCVQAIPVAVLLVLKRLESVQK